MPKRSRFTQDSKPEGELEFLENSKEYKMLNDLQNNRTLYDKISVIIRKLEITQAREFCNFNSIRTLPDMAKKKSRHHSEAAVDGLTELFIEKLGKPRKPAENEKENENLDG